MDVPQYISDYTQSKLSFQSGGSSVYKMKKKLGDMSSFVTSNTGPTSKNSSIDDTPTSRPTFAEIRRKIFEAARARSEKVQTAGVVTSEHEKNTREMRGKKKQEEKEEAERRKHEKKAGQAVSDFLKAEEARRAKLAQPTKAFVKDTSTVATKRPITSRHFDADLHQDDLVSLDEMEATDTLAKIARLETLKQERERREKDEAEAEKQGKKKSELLEKRIKRLVKIAAKSVENENDLFPFIIKNFKQLLASKDLGICESEEDISSFTDIGTRFKDLKISLPDYKDCNLFSEFVLKIDSLAQEEFVSQTNLELGRKAIERERAKLDKWKNFEAGISDRDRVAVRSQSERAYELWRERSGQPSIKPEVMRASDEHVYSQTGASKIPEDEYMKTVVNEFLDWQDAHKEPSTLIKNRDTKKSDLEKSKRVEDEMSEIAGISQEKACSDFKILKNMGAISGFYENNGLKFAVVKDLKGYEQNLYIFLIAGGQIFKSKISKKEIAENVLPLKVAVEVLPGKVEKHNTNPVDLKIPLSEISEFDPTYRNSDFMSFIDILENWER